MIGVPLTCLIQLNVVLTPRDQDCQWLLYFKAWQRAGLFCCSCYIV